MVHGQCCAFVLGSGWFLFSKMASGWWFLTMFFEF